MKPVEGSGQASTKPAPDPVILKAGATNVTSVSQSWQFPAAAQIRGTTTTSGTRHSVTVRFPGQTTTGGSESRTITRKVHWADCPALFVAVQVTRLVPTGNTPDGGAQVTTTFDEQPPLGVGRTYCTKAEHRPGLFDTWMSSGQTRRSSFVQGTQFGFGCTAHLPPAPA